MSRTQRWALAVMVLPVLLSLGACAADSGSGGSSTTPTGGSTAESPSTTPTPTPTPTPDPLADLTLAQKVGQLFMVGTKADALSDTTVAAIRDRHVGSAFLAGRSKAGVQATAGITAQLHSLVGPDSTAGVPLLIATDQEGGQVQVLSGPGFSTIPTGLAQGAMAPAQLQQNAGVWGAELSAAGVNMNLAPVVDLIPAAEAAEGNPPIGAFRREYGFDPATIVSHADAFRAGMAASGIVSTIKHFPGLGSVSQNTDTTANVVDSVTVADGASAGVFRSEIANGADVVMMSSAVYARIDPNAPAVFSQPIVTGLLRGTFGFTGVIMTDDVSAAVAVTKWSPADRAIMALEAGVDLVLVSADQSVVPAMVDAVLAKAQADPAFAAIVDRAATRVVELKRTALAG